MIDDIIDRLRHIVAEQLDANLTLAEIDPDMPVLEGGLGLDSIMVVELINLIEENFGVQFAEGDLNTENFVNLRTVAAFIASRLTEAAESEPQKLQVFDPGSQTVGDSV